MKKVLLLIVLIVVAAHASVSPLAQSRLAEFLAGGAPFDFILIDVRTSEEIDAVIGTAACRPYNLAWPEPFMRDSARIPKDRTIVVYCRTGGRASGAANYLASQGYERVYNAGGILTWDGPTLPPSGIKPTELLPEPSMRALSGQRSALDLFVPLLPGMQPEIAGPVPARP